MEQKPASKAQAAPLTPATDDSARLAQIRALVEAHNQSTLDTELII